MNNDLPFGAHGASALPYRLVEAMTDYVCINTWHIEGLPGEDIHVFLQ